MRSSLGNSRKGNGGGAGWLVTLRLKGMSGTSRVKDAIGNCATSSTNLISRMSKPIGRSSLSTGTGCSASEGAVGEAGWSVLDEETMRIALGLVCEPLRTGRFVAGIVVSRVSQVAQGDWWRYRDFRRGGPEAMFATNPKRE